MATETRIRDFRLLPREALLSVNDLVLLSGRSRTSIWRDVRHGRLPKPVRVGPNCVRWQIDDVRKFLAGGAI